MPGLFRLDIHQQVSAHYRYYTFGVLLLNDETGNRVNIIEDECHGKPERVVLRILQEWMEGKGLPVNHSSRHSVTQTSQFCQTR